MNLKLVCLSLISVFFSIPTVVFAMYSATPGALKAFQRIPGSAPKVYSRPSNFEESWAGKLEQRMNPGAFENVFNEAALPQATINPALLNEVVTTPVTSIVPVTSRTPNFIQLTQNPNFVAPMFYGGLNPTIVQHSLAYFRTKFLENALVENFFQGLLSEGKVLALDNDPATLRWFVMKNQELNELIDSFVLYDAATQEKVLMVQQFLTTTMNLLQDRITWQEKMQARDKDFQAGLQHIREIAQAKKEGKFIPAEEGQIPVENPYDQFKEDVKGQFYHGAKLGGIGAGTVYGLHKLKNNR